MTEKKNEPVDARTMADTEQRAAAGGKGDRPAKVRAPKEVESAAAHEVIPDALGGEPQERQVAGQVLDKTAVAKIDGHEAAVPGEDQEVGPHGLSLPAAGEVAGGNIERLLAAPPATEAAARPMVKEQAAMMTKVGRELAGLIARPITEWGIIGPGETIRGHMLLLDLNTGEKVRAMDGHRVNKGELYMNLRNVPEALSTGDTIARVLEA